MDCVMKIVTQAGLFSAFQKTLNLLGIFAVLSVALSVSHAGPRVFTLDCQSERAWPTGVPATLTSYENLQVFQRWCDESGVSELDIEMSHTPDLRMDWNGVKSYILEGSTRFDGDDYNSLQEAQAALPSKKPQTYHETLITTYPNGDTVEFKSRLEYQSGDTWNNYISSKIAYGDYVLVSRFLGNTILSGLGESCANGSFFAEKNLQNKVYCLYRTKQKAVRKKSCPPHHYYTFVNTKSKETTEFFRDGGSCYTFRPVRYASPKRGPLKEGYFIFETR